MSAGGDVDKSKLSESGKYPVIANALTDDGIVGYYDDTFRIKAPAVTVTGRGDVGHAKARNVDFTPVVRLLALETEHDTNFLENAINTINIVNESTGVPQLTVPQLSKYMISIPSTLEEEKKIGEYFVKLNHLITLHQRKCDQAKKLKKYMLQNMFPQDGEKTPKIRFDDFTDDWEQRKLGEISNSFSGGTPSVSVKEYYNGSIPFIRSAEINSDSTELFITENGLNNSSARLVNQGDILYAMYGATSGEVGRSKQKGAINQAILAIIPQEGYDSEFITQWLKKNKKSIVATYLQGGQGNLSARIVKNLIVDYPKYIEQQKIGQYFQRLDHLITLH